MCAVDAVDYTAVALAHEGGAVGRLCLGEGALDGEIADGAGGAELGECTHLAGGEGVFDAGELVVVAQEGGVPLVAAYGGEVLAGEVDVGH